MTTRMRTKTCLRSLVPYCGETVYFEDSIDPDHIPCPACGKTFDIEQAACGDCDSDSCEGCVLEETHHLDDEV